MTSMKSSQKIVLTTDQLIEAQKAHGDDFVQINFESIRNCRYSQYLDIDIKLANGTVTPIRYWKLSNDGIVVASRLRAPEQRQYAQIRLGVALFDDETGEENENCKALQLLCTAFENKMRKYKSEEVITDDERAPRKQADGTMRPVHLISTKIVSPMQTASRNRETDEMEDLENPRFWLSLPNRRFYKQGETPRPSVHFEDKYYQDVTGQPNMEAPVMTFEYAMDFYNVDDWYHNSRTGKKIYKKLGAPDGDNNMLDNTNIQDYLTKGSALMGNLKFELAVSGRQCKLNIDLYGRYYVKHADIVEGGLGEADEEAVEMFSNKHKSIAKSESTNIPNDDADAEFDEE